MNHIKTKTVREIVTENFLASNIFNRYGIDFFTKGDTTLAEACQKQALNVSNIEQEIQGTQQIRTHHFNNWEIDYLIDYILNNHHYYIWVNLPIIKEYTLKVSREQGLKHPVTIEVNRLFKELASELEHHLLFEEQQLFPYIKDLVFSNRDNKANPLGDTLLALSAGKTEHEYLTAKLKVIVTLLEESELVKIPETMTTVLLYKIKAFQKDLEQHIHLENNILFPKASKLEKEFD
jgi:regulator of cell morphogenesis and NO signaling